MSLMGMGKKWKIEKGKVNMDNMQGLRAGVAEMRSVASRLLSWADDLEASFRGRAGEPACDTDGTPAGNEAEAPVAEEVSAAGLRPAEKKKRAAKPAGVEQAAAPEKGKTLTLANSGKTVRLIRTNGALSSVETVRV